MRAILKSAMGAAFVMLGPAAAARFSARHAADAQRAVSAPGPSDGNSVVGSRAARGPHSHAEAHVVPPVSSALDLATMSNATGVAVPRSPLGRGDHDVGERHRRRFVPRMSALASALLVGLGGTGGVLEKKDRRHEPLHVRGGAFVPASASRVAVQSGVPVGVPPRLRLPTAEPAPLAYGPNSDDDEGEERTFLPLSQDVRTNLRNEEALATVTALGERGFVEVKLPPEWAGNFVPTSIKHVSGSSREGQDVYRALLEADPSFTVLLKIRPTSDPRTQREIRMWERLTELSGAGLVSMGNIAPLLELQVFSETTFFLFAAGSGTLRELMDFERGSTVSEMMGSMGPLDEVPDAGQPILSPSKGLPLMIDVLRGMKNLEEAGIVHAGLSESNILLIDGRAYISDLSTSCLAHDGDDELCCSNMQDVEGSFIGSAFRHAPEMHDTGHPEPASTDWAFGLVLAESLLGYPPTEAEDHENSKALDISEVGRRTIRWSILNSFNIEHAAGFDQLPPWAQEALQGLLSRNKHMRMNAGRALGVLSSAAAKLGVPVPGEPKKIKLPKGWWNGWFKGLAWQ